MKKASCLSLLSNAVLVWNTVHIARQSGELAANQPNVTDRQHDRYFAERHA